MNRKLAAVTLLACFLALAAAACGDNGSVIVANSPDQTGITVSGTGEVVVEPDTGFIDIGVQITRRTVAEAREAAAAPATQVIESVRNNGVDQKDIQTAGFAIYPQYQYPRDGGEPTISGYQVVNAIAVTVRDLDRFSRIIDDATAAGGDDVRMNGIRFGLEDREQALTDAREAAMADARRKADQLARAGGVSLGRPLYIEETQAPGQQALNESFARDAALQASTPVEPGTGKITVTVTVRYAIE